MPGLLRGMARTAAVAGTASAVSGRVQRRQAEKFATRDQQIASTRAQGWSQGMQSAAPQQAPPPPPAPAAAPQVDVIGQLKQLAELKEQGILTEAEFAAQKAKLLG
ncbi:MAG: SHOCT domain-containing protein [Actinomycetota bacterium]